MQTVPFLDLKIQYRSLQDELDAAVKSHFVEGNYIGGESVRLFEDSFAHVCKRAECIGVANGTDALFIILKMLGIGHGDEVITAANTFIATAEAISMTGAVPVFADCGEDFLISAETIESRITSRTKAVIPVHLYGQCCDMDELARLAKHYQIHLIEDACQAHGALWNGRPAGSFGIAAAFSFYPGKNLGASGDAGAIVTNDVHLAQRMRSFANHGREGHTTHAVIGLNSRLDALHASVLRVKLQYLNEWNNRRHQIAKQYSSALVNIVDTPLENEHTQHVYHLYVIRIQNHRDRVQSYLTERGVMTGIHYPAPIPFTPAYRHLGITQQSLPTAWRMKDELLSLPLYPEMTDTQVEYVIDEVQDAVVSCAPSRSASV